MNTKILLIFAVFALGVVSCGKKKEDLSKTVTREVVKPEVVAQDTLPEMPEVEEEPLYIEKPHNKYFLISASFSIESNAVAYRDKLIDEGFDSEVIIRENGVNPDFFKVSYKGFADKGKALEELTYEIEQPGKENVWLLVKR